MKLPFLAVMALAFGMVATSRADEDTSRVFEIRTYTTAEGKLEDLHRRFREHTLKLFERHGMVNVAYWTPQDPERAGNTLVYLLAHKSRQAAAQSWAAFLADPEWKQVRAASEANGKIVLKVESTFVQATDYSPMK
ncbi:NIPSNAP family protein [Steroidobacter sp. S1-65]|uniref:NIPSNAP family protein n=1 Tax=Steroidobacter gossypii TaxID=2805490 RepID=A0ABS1X083_9GAMM|nr:NIPSNAP family protein [Steroidobacter gossypii]MBM0106587.1 NIPSNAP family protein [Steroidobacter gossypii]